MRKEFFYEPVSSAILSTLAHIEHYTKAADILAITQPSLSYAISTLEEELG